MGPLLEKSDDGGAKRGEESEERRRGAPTWVIKQLNSAFS